MVTSSSRRVSRRIPLRWRGKSRRRNVLKRARAQVFKPQKNVLLFLFGQLHEHVHTATGEPLNVHLMLFIGAQHMASVCCSGFKWACLAGRRFCPCINDSRGPPFAKIERVALNHVDIVHLGQYGRNDPAERAHVILSCRRAKRLLCFYGDLSGLSVHLDLGHGITPCLRLLDIRLRGCHLAADDVARLLKCAPAIEHLSIVDEELFGLADVVQGLPGLCTRLKTLQLINCELSGLDAASMLGLSPLLRSAKLQSMGLRGLSMAPAPDLEELSVVDCHVCLHDAINIMKACPALKSLELCGNPLSSGTIAGQHCWPSMGSLQYADFRMCHLDIDDEEALRAALPSTATLYCCSVAGQAPQHHQQQHLIFDSESSDSQ